MKEGDVVKLKILVFPAQKEFRYTIISVSKTTVSCYENSNLKCIYTHINKSSLQLI